MLNCRGIVSPKKLKKGVLDRENSKCKGMEMGEKIQYLEKRK